MSPDERRFHAIVDATFVDVWRFVRRRCASPEDADDVVSEIYAVAWRRISDVPKADGARLWLFGVARRVLSNNRRSAARAVRLLDRIEADAARPDAEVDHALSAALADALGTLSELDLSIVTMRNWDDLAVQEIATVVGLTPNAVSIRLHRVHRQLAAHIDRWVAADRAIDGGAEATGGQS